MKILSLCVLLFAPSLLAAGDKASITLNEGSYSAMGGVKREKAFNVQVSKGMFDKNLTVDEQILALEQKLVFLKLVKKHAISLDAEINATYKEVPLKKVLGELLPNVPVKFTGVSEDVTVGSLTVTKVALGKVCDYLDDAAGVYFSFTPEGIIVTGEAPKAP